LPFPDDLAKAVEDRDLVLLHQIGHAGGVLVDDARLVLLNGGEVVAEAFGFESELFKLACFLIKMGRVEQCFRRNTASQTACSAELRVFFFFNDRDF
jgi:hypothetical protein